MRILHTADWHLGKRLENYNRIAEQREVLEEICTIVEQEKIDVVIVAGDLFDTFNPPVEAVELLYKTLKRLSNNGRRPVIAIAGNHDSADRIESPDPLARECGIIFAGYPDTTSSIFELESGLKMIHSEPGFIALNIPGSNVPLRILLTPYANEQRLKSYLGIGNEVENINELLREKWDFLAQKYCDEKGINLLVTHLYMMQKGGQAPDEPDDERPIHIGNASAIFTENIPAEIQYTALGHLHRLHSVPGSTHPAYYSGSPLNYSFAEAGQKKYTIIVEVEPGGDAEIKKVELTKGRMLHRKRFENIEEAVQWLTDNPHTLVELTIVCDTYLKAEDKKRLLQAHDGIITIIPDIKNRLIVHNSGKQVDLTMQMDELFQEYFQYKKGQKPNTALMELFQEIKTNTK